MSWRLILTSLLENFDPCWKILISVMTLYEDWCSLLLDVVCTEYSLSWHSWLSLFCIHQSFDRCYEFDTYRSWYRSWLVTEKQIKILAALSSFSSLQDQC